MPLSLALYNSYIFLIFMRVYGYYVGALAFLINSVIWVKRKMTMNCLLHLYYNEQIFTREFFLSNWR